MTLKTVTLDRDVLGGIFKAGQQFTYDSRLGTIDDGLAFYASQLAVFEPRWYETKYASIDFQELVPVNTSTPEWANEVAWRMYDGVTLGKFIGANADDLPRVALSAKMFKAPIGYAGNEFGYSLDEMRTASHLGLPLDDAEARMARRGAEEHTQRVVYFGDSDRGMTGLFNNPNVPTANSLLDWFDPATTPLEIVEDINRILNEVYENTKGVSLADTLVLSSNRYEFLATTYASTLNPTETIMDLIEKKNLYTVRTKRPLTIVPRFQITQEELPNYISGYADGDLIVAYEKNAENLETHIPMPWRPSAPQPRGLKIVVPAEYKASGTQFRYPLTAVYSKQIKRT